MSKLQYRTRGKGPHSTCWEWRDASELRYQSWADEEGGFYFSSVLLRDNYENDGDFLDIEVRIKPPYVPGYYQELDNGFVREAARVSWMAAEPDSTWRRVEVLSVD